MNQQGQGSGRTGHENITDLVMYNTPRSGFYQGRILTLEGVGNEAGKSVVYWAINEQCQRVTPPANEVIPFGLCLIPPSAEQFNQAVELGLQQKVSGR